MEEDLMQKLIERKGDRPEPEHEPNRFRPPKIELFRKNDDAYKFEPLNRNRILKAPVREARIIKVEPIWNTNKQQIFKHDIIRSKLPKLAPYDVAHPKNKSKLLNQLP